MRIRKTPSKPIKAAAQAIPSSGLPHTTGGSLRQAVAASIRAEVRLTGKNTGVSIKARSTPNLRGFSQAARAMNARSFRHKVYGGKWVAQVGKPRWFDETASRDREAFRNRVMSAVDDMARRIAARARS